MTDLKSVGIHGTELAGYSSVVGQPIMLKNEAGNYIGQIALIGFQGEYKEAVAAIAEALDVPSRHAYKVGFAAGRADALRQAAHLMPRHFGVWSSTGVHIGVWDDGATAAKVLGEYPGGVMRDLIDAAAIAAMIDKEPTP